jgi:ABC-2 type transport system permease protein
MSKHAMEVLITGSAISSVIGNVLIAFVWIFLTLFVTNYWIAHKKFNHE